MSSHTPRSDQDNEIRASRTHGAHNRLFAKRPTQLSRKVTRGRFRNVVFTLPNPSEEDRRRCTSWELADRMTYLILQEEKCPKTGTIHLQGYCEFAISKHFNAIKKALFGRRTHIERRMGSQEQAIEYCRKEESRVIDGISLEIGEPKRQGFRSDLKATSGKVAQKILAGDDLHQIEEDHPGFFMMHKQKVIDAYIENLGVRNNKPNNNNVHIFVGPSGSGKSTTAKRENPDAYLGIWPTGGRWWWPNYRGQETVIFDEFRENLSYQQMLGLLDIHPLGIEYKGGNCQMVSKKVVITTIRDPKEWYKKVKDKSELERRIRENCTIYDFTGGTYPNFTKVARDMATFEFQPYQEPFNFTV